MEKNPGEPRVEKGERKTQNQDVEEGVVDDIGEGGAEGVSETNGGSEPFGEGAKVGPEEGVDGVDKRVVRAEPAIRGGHQPYARPQGVHHVRTWSWHSSHPLILTNCSDSSFFQ